MVKSLKNCNRPPTVYLELQSTHNRHVIADIAYDISDVYKWPKTPTENAESRWLRTPTENDESRWLRNPISSLLIL